VTARGRSSRGASEWPNERAKETGKRQEYRKRVEACQEVVARGGKGSTMGEGTPLSWVVPRVKKIQSPQGVRVVTRESIEKKLKTDGILSFTCAKE